MFADKTVADTRCFPAGALEHEHNSEVSLQEIAILFDPADYAWVRTAGGAGLEKRMRRQRHAAVKALLGDLRAEGQRQLEAWRTVAAADRDYSGPDPALEMLWLLAGIRVVKTLAWCQIAQGWPMPGVAKALAWCDRPALRRAATVQA